jgi:c-di-GMP-binding flagellar brake protein YcgR
MDERRRFPRVRSELAVGLRPLAEPGRESEGSLSADLSAGGVRLTSFRFIPRDARMVLHLAPREIGRDLRAVARVTWVRERPLGERFDYGLEFVEISDEDRGAISGLVERGVVLQ